MSMIMSSDPRRKLICVRSESLVTRADRTQCSIRRVAPAVREPTSRRWVAELCAVSGASQPRAF
jgi:hypothetical protein